MFVFSYFHRNDDRGILLPNWSRLQEAASQITGPEQLGSMVLYGTPITGLSFDILDGPTQTVSFTPTGYTESIQFPSLHLFSQNWNGAIYIIAVNSTDQNVSAQISNLPTSSPLATVLFQNRVVPVTDGQFVDSFSAWGVNLYKVENEWPQ